MCGQSNLQVHTLLSQRHECLVPARFSKTELKLLGDKGDWIRVIPRRDLRRCNQVLCRKEDDQLISTVTTTNEQNMISIKTEKN